MPCGCTPSPVLSPQADAQEGALSTFSPQYTLHCNAGVPHPGPSHLHRLSGFYDTHQEAASNSQVPWTAHSRLSSLSPD